MHLRHMTRAPIVTVFSKVAMDRLVSMYLIVQGSPYEGTMSIARPQDIACAGWLFPAPNDILDGIVSQRDVSFRPAVATT